MTDQAKSSIPEQGTCPNPNGSTVEFGEDVVQARAWRLKGVGMYGSDVDVIDIEAYRELSALQTSTMETLSRWAATALKFEKALKLIATRDVPVIDPDLDPEDHLAAFARQTLEIR